MEKYNKKIFFLFRENDRLKEQLRSYMSAVEMGKAMKTSNGEDEEITQYERKLVQVCVRQRKYADKEFQIKRS